MVPPDMVWYGTQDTMMVPKYGMVPPRHLIFPSRSCRRRDQARGMVSAALTEAVVSPGWWLCENIRIQFCDIYKPIKDITEYYKTYQHMITN